MRELFSLLDGMDVRAVSPSADGARLAVTYLTPDSQQHFGVINFRSRSLVTFPRKLDDPIGSLKLLDDGHIVAFGDGIDIWNAKGERESTASIGRPVDPSRTIDDFVLQTAERTEVWAGRWRLGR